MKICHWLRFPVSSLHCYGLELEAGEGLLEIQY